MKKLMRMVMAGCVAMAVGTAYAQDTMKKDAMKGEMKKEMMGKGMEKGSMMKDDMKKY